MTLNKTIFSLAMVAFLFVVSTQAMCAGHIVDQAPPGSLFERGDRGWFWYEDPPPEPEEDRSVDESDAQPPPPKDEAVTKKQEISPEPSGPRPLSAAWLRENIEKFKDQAIDNPSQANILAYLYLQKVAMDKASRFSRAYKMTLAGHPVLDESGLLSTASLKFARIRGTEKRRNALLDRLSKKIGLFFFYTKDCDDCGAQAALLKEMRTRYGVTVSAVSMDGSMVPPDVFDAVFVDSGQAQKMGVSKVPAIVAAVPPDRYMPIGQGKSYTLPEIINLYLMVGYRAGLVTDTEMDSLSVPRPAPQFETYDPEKMDPREFQSPESIVKYLEGLVQR